jgi:hypothetical protein
VLCRERAGGKRLVNRTRSVERGSDVTFTLLGLYLRKTTVILDLSTTAYMISLEIAYNRTSVTTSYRSSNTVWFTLNEVLLTLNKT